MTSPAKRHREKLRRRVEATLRDKYRAEFEELRASMSYNAAMKALRDRHYAEYERLLPDEATYKWHQGAVVHIPVPPGKAMCAVGCGKPLLQHRIGECR